LQPASEEGFKLKGWRREEKGRIYFEINIACAEKIATFAARSEERKLNNISILKSVQRGKRRPEKIKFILFGSLKKILTFALPTERKGKKIGTADVGKITEKD
jgi:hypothetical protein